jgi:hypothetical protein
MHHDSVTRLRTFDFHDGEVVRVIHDGKDVKMLFKNWQEIFFELVFINTLTLSIFDFPSWPEALIESGSSSLLIQEALENLIQMGCSGSELNPDKYVALSLECEGQPLTVVFENVLITEVSSDSVT